MKPCRNSFPLGCPGRREISRCSFRRPQRFQQPFPSSPKASTPLLQHPFPPLWMDPSMPFFFLLILGHIMCPHMMFNIHVLEVVLTFFFFFVKSSSSHELNKEETFNLFFSRNFHHKSLTNLHSLEMQIYFTKSFC